MGKHTNAKSYEASTNFLSYYVTKMVNSLNCPEGENARFLLAERVDARASLWLRCLVAWHRWNRKREELHWTYPGRGCMGRLRPSSQCDNITSPPPKNARVKLLESSDYAKKK